MDLNFNEPVKKILVLDIDDTVINEHAHNDLSENYGISYQIPYNEMDYRTRIEYDNARKEILRKNGIKNLIPLRNTIKDLLAKGDCLIKIGTHSRYPEMIYDVLSVILYDKTADMLNNDEKKEMKDILNNRISFKENPRTAPDESLGKNASILEAKEECKKRWGVEIENENIILFDDSERNREKATWNKEQCLRKKIPFVGLSKENTVDPNNNANEVEFNPNPITINTVRLKFGLNASPIRPTQQIREEIRGGRLKKPVVPITLIPEEELKEETDKPSVLPKAQLAVIENFIKHRKKPIKLRRQLHNKDVEDKDDPKKIIAKAGSLKEDLSILDKQLLKALKDAGAGVLKNSILVDEHGKIFILSSSAEDKNKVIGKGKYGKVISGYDAKTQEKRAIKIVETDEEISDQMEDEESASREANLAISSLVNEREKLVTKKVEESSGYGGYMRTVTKTGKVKIKKKYNIMVLKPGVHLYKYVNFGEKYRNVAKPIPYNESLEIASKITQLVLDMHQKGSIHRDIQPENILIDKDSGEVSLVDMGHARHLKEGQEGILSNVPAGHPRFRAPEADLPITEENHVAHYSHSKASDVYSLGKTLEIVLNSILNHMPPSLQSQTLKAEVEALLLRMTSTRKENRPSAEEVLKMIRQIQENVKPHISEIQAEFQRESLRNKVIKQLSTLSANSNLFAAFSKYHDTQGRSLSDFFDKDSYFGYKHIENFMKLPQFHKLPQNLQNYIKSWHNLSMLKKQLNEIPTERNEPFRIIIDKNSSPLEQQRIFDKANIALEEQVLKAMEAHESIVLDLTHKVREKNNIIEKKIGAESIPKIEPEDAGLKSFDWDYDDKLDEQYDIQKPLYDAENAQSQKLHLKLSDIIKEVLTGFKEANYHDDKGNNLANFPEFFNFNKDTLKKLPQFQQLPLKVQDYLRLWSNLEELKYQLSLPPNERREPYRPNINLTSNNADIKQALDDKIGKLEADLHTLTENINLKIKDLAIKERKITGEIVDPLNQVKNISAAVSEEQSWFYDDKLDAEFDEKDIKKAIEQKIKDEETLKKALEDKAKEAKESEAREREAKEREAKLIADPKADAKELDAAIDKAIASIENLPPYGLIEEVEPEKGPILTAFQQQINKDAIVSRPLEDPLKKPSGPRLE